MQAAADPTEVLAAHWNESERRLYPVATTDPSAYEAAVRAVRAVADALRDAVTLDDLAASWERRHEVAGTALRTSPTVARAEAVGAAFALRRRELLSEIQHRRRRDRIARARDAGEPWALIHEQGDLSAGLSDPYQRVELHLATGLAVVSAVEADPSTMKPNLVVSVASVEDGEPDGPSVDADAFADEETADYEEFERARRDMRRRVEEAGR